VRSIRVHEFGGPSVLQLQEGATPTPGPEDVLVRVESAGVNFIEVYQRTGQYVVPLPATPGSEGAGVVEAVGAGVSGIRTGDRVVSQGLSGSYAEFAVAPADRVVVLPEGIPFDVGAAAMLQGLTAHYLVRSTYPLRAGEVCLITAAAGGVGLLLCQLARLVGATAIAVASTREKRELALGAGAAVAVDYDEAIDTAKSLTRGAGVSVVYDSVGRDTFMESLKCLAPRGTMVLFGQSSGPVAPIDPQLLNRSGSLFLTRPMLAHYVATPVELKSRSAELFDWILRGDLKIRIHAKYRLADARLAHQALEERKTTGKVLLEPGR
jgi:NADPH:quinone reductase